MRRSQLTCDQPETRQLLRCLGHQQRHHQTWPVGIGILQEGRSVSGLHTRSRDHLCQGAFCSRRWAGMGTLISSSFGAMRAFLVKALVARRASSSSGAVPSCCGDLLGRRLLHYPHAKPKFVQQPRAGRQSKEFVHSSLNGHATCMFQFILWTSAP